MYKYESLSEAIGLLNVHDFHCVNTSTGTHCEYYDETKQSYCNREPCSCINELRELIEPYKECDGDECE